MLVCSYIFLQVFSGTLFVCTLPWTDWISEKMLTFIASALIGGHRSQQSTRSTCRRRARTTACASEMYADNAPKWSQGEVCTYCHNEKTVVCPVCEGEGRISRSIICYYCRGRKYIPCPLCSIDDPYEFSYTAVPDGTLQIEEGQDVEHKESESS